MSKCENFVENHQPNIARLSDKPVTIRKKRKEKKNSSESYAGIPKWECGKEKKYLLDNVISPESCLS